MPLPFLRQQKGDAESEARRRGFTPPRRCSPSILLGHQGGEGLSIPERLPDRVYDAFHVVDGFVVPEA